MLQAERRREIIEWVNQYGRITIADICAHFNVCDMTARRDLRELDREGLLRRVHGGAVSSLRRSYEAPFQMRASDHAAPKERIGRAAAALIHDGDSVAFDTGTTTLEAARALRDQRNLTILTTSLPIANEIAARFPLESGVRLIVAGGIVRPNELSMIGSFTEQMCSQIHVDRAFVGFGGLTLEEGLTEYNLEDAMVKQALLRSAQQKIAVIDSSKFGRVTFASVGPPTAVDIIITDADAPPDMLAALRDLGVQVIVAE